MIFASSILMYFIEITSLSTEKSLSSSTNFDYSQNAIDLFYFQVR